MSHHIVEAKELYYTYPDGTKGIDGISFRVTHGESVAIVGANGAGKSTFLLHMNGYIFADKGSLQVGDFIITKKNISQIRKSVGMVFQDPDDQLFMPTVYDDVAFGPLNLGCTLDEVNEIVKKSLKTTGVLHLIDRPPYKLSGGEKRSVAIASVLAMSPDILVMDEPTSNLDPRTRRKLIELMKTFEHTKIIATHDLDMALDVCERTIVIHKGKVIADGPTIDLFMDEDILSKSNLEKPLGLQGCPLCNRKNESAIKEVHRKISAI